MRLSKIWQICLIALTFEGIFFFLGFPVQSLSPFFLISFFLLSCVKLQIYRLDPILKIILSVIAYLYLVTAVNVVLELVLRPNMINERFYYLSRQSISISVGLIEYFAFFYIFYFNDNYSFRAVVMIIVLYLFTSSLVEVLLLHRYRAQNLFSEPSHLAEFEAFICIPMVYLSIKSRVKQRVLLIMAAITVLLTFSTTGILRVILFYIGIAFSDKEKRKRVIGLIIIIIGLLSFYISRQDNYMSNMIKMTIGALRNGQALTKSLTDRTAFFDYINMAVRNRNYFGFGVGGEAYETLIASQKQLDIIKAEKMWGMSIVSMPAKFLVYCGLFGLALFLGVYYCYFLRRSWNTCGPIVFSVFFAIGVYMFVGLSSFSLPYFWFWAAYLSVRSMRGGKNSKAGEIQ